MRIGCGSLSIATLVSLLANEIDVQSVLHGQVSLAAVNQICVMHDAVKGCKKSTNSRKCKNAGQAMAVLIVSMVNARTPPRGVRALTIETMVALPTVSVPPQ